MVLAFLENYPLGVWLLLQVYPWGVTMSTYRVEVERRNVVGSAAGNLCGEFRPVRFRGTKTAAVFIWPVVRVVRRRPAFPVTSRSVVYG